MKQFDLQEFLKNPTRPIVTRDGHAARIICTNRICKTHPILALLFEDEDRDTEVVYQYTSQGEYYSNASSPHDLFFAPEKKIGWINLYKYKDDIVTDKFILHSKEEALIQRDIYEDSYIATIKIEWEE